MALTAAARSGPVSANVPSKSNSTARLVTPAAQEIVDVAVAPEPVLAGKRVVSHADQLVRSEHRVAREARELGGLDEAQIVVRAAWQQAQHIFGADDREEIRLRVAVDRRKENLAARADEPCAGRHHARRLGHVLEKLHARNDIERGGMLRRILLGAR